MKGASGEKQKASWQEPLAPSVRAPALPRRTSSRLAAPRPLAYTTAPKALLPFSIWVMSLRELCPNHHPFPTHKSQGEMVRGSHSNANSFDAHC